MSLERNAIHLGDALHMIDEVDDESLDLIVCDGPYGVTAHEWDRIANIQEYNLDLIRRFSEKLKDGGALYLFGKPNCIDFIDYRPYLNLKSKIVWYQPSRLAQGRINFTNNYDIICYFIKGDRPRCYNLDSIRVSQLVELEHRLRCERVPSVTTGKYGKTKFNGKGKNPGDVWGDIKQLTYKSKELVCREALNTIQKPIRLVERLVLASSNPGDLVLDPFSGVGTCPVVCQTHGRDFVAFEINPEFVALANARLHRVDLQMPQAILYASDQIKVKTIYELEPDVVEHEAIRQMDVSGLEKPHVNLSESWASKHGRVVFSDTETT